MSGLNLRYVEKEERGRIISIYYFISYSAMFRILEYPLQTTGENSNVTIPNLIDRRHIFFAYGSDGRQLCIFGGRFDETIYKFHYFNDAWVFVPKELQK